MQLGRLASVARRALGHLFVDRGYERHHSAATWEAAYRDGYHLEDPREDARYGVLLALVRRWERGGPILDLGCGDGVLAQRIRSISAAPLVGVDHAPTAIERARARALPGCEFLCRDFRELPDEPRFSLAVLNEALYYLDDPAGLLRLAARQLRPDGVVLVSMFETLVTARTWRAIRGDVEVLQSVQVRDDGSGIRWRIRVGRPAGVEGRSPKGEANKRRAFSARSAVRQSGPRLRGPDCWTRLEASCLAGRDPGG